METSFELRFELLLSKPHFPVNKTLKIKVFFYFIKFVEQIKFFILSSLF